MKTDLRGIHGLCPGDLPGYLRRFRQLHPEAAITLREGGREEILEALSKEELDVIIVPDYGLNLGRRFEALELSCERAKFITGPHTPLAGRKYVSPTELAGQTIFRVEGTGDEAQEQPCPATMPAWGWGRTPSSGSRPIWRPPFWSRPA